MSTAAQSTAISAPAPRAVSAADAASPEAAPFPGGAAGAPRLLLRLEGALVLAAALLAYGHLQGSWARFATLFLLPDLSMLAYLAGPRAGAAAYNAAHSYLGAGLLALGAAAIGAPALYPFALIWIAHVAFDRMAGYGLKYGTAFSHTHLGLIGRPGARGEMAARGGPGRAGAAVG